MSLSLVLTQRNYNEDNAGFIFVTDSVTEPHVLFVFLLSRYRIPGISKHSQRRMKKSVLIIFVLLQVFRFRKEAISSRTILLGQRISVISSSLNHTRFTLTKKFTYNLPSTTWITLILPWCTRPQHHGSKALTALILKPVLLELVGMTTLQTALPQLIGLPIKVHRLGV